MKKCIRIFPTWYYIGIVVIGIIAMFKAVIIHDQNFALSATLLVLIGLLGVDTR